MTRLAWLAVAWCAVQAALADGPRALPDPVVMMWQVAGEDPASGFAELAALGVNTVQSFGLAWTKPDYVERYLAAAESAGIAVIPFIGDRPRDPARSCGLPAAGADFIRRHRESSAIVAWHSADEPSLREVSRECQRRLYAEIKAIDPARPVLVSINYTTQREYDGYFAEDAFDVLDLHKYVNPRVGRSQRNLVELFRRNRKKAYPVIMTLRAFDAPAKPLRLDMREGGLAAQYRFFIEESGITRNVGFYGWDLSSNLGIPRVPWLRREFEALMRDRIRPAAAPPLPGSTESAGHRCRSR